MTNSTLTQKTTNKSYVFSKKAASVILGIKINEIKYLEEIQKGFIARLTNSKGMFISTDKFYEYFVTSRKERGELLMVHQLSDVGFYVPSSKPDEYYFVNLIGDEIHCNCKDWEIQNEIGIKQPCCKHIYAVLKKLGHESLKDYLEYKARLSEAEEGYFLSSLPY